MRRSLLLLVLAAGCGGTNPPAFDWSQTNAEELVANNPPCDAQRKCEAGRSCSLLVLRDGDHPVCLQGDACALLVCPPEWECLTQTSLPARVGCAHFGP